MWFLLYRLAGWCRGFLPGPLTQPLLTHITGKIFYFIEIGQDAYKIPSFTRFFTDVLMIIVKMSYK
jgi:hypothetical protein